MQKKMVLIRTDPEKVFIRNNAGVQVSFDSFSEFEDYSGITIPGSIKRVNYEPDDNLFIVNGSPKDIATQGGPYEAQIADVETYAARKADEFFNLVDLDEAKSIKRTMIDTRYRIAKDEEYEQGANRLSPHGLQTLEEISRLALLAKANGDTAWTIDAIMATTDGNGLLERKTFNADQILGFMQNMYQRNENLNQAAQNHKDAINLLTTVEDVKNYPVPENV